MSFSRQASFAKRVRDATATPARKRALFVTLAQMPGGYEEVTGVALAEGLGERAVRDMGTQDVQTLANLCKHVLSWGWTRTRPGKGWTPRPGTLDLMRFDGKIPPHWANYSFMLGAGGGAKAIAYTGRTGFGEILADGINAGGVRPVLICDHCRVPYLREGRKGRFCSTYCRAMDHREKTAGGSPGRKDTSERGNPVDPAG